MGFLYYGTYTKTKSMRRSGPEYLQSSTKRGLDVLGSAVITVAMLPSVAAAYGLAAADNKSFKPIFTHERVGFEGKKFLLSKIRTLRPELVFEGRRGQGAYDSRASEIGTLLRRYGLDEVPQLKNVIEGDMSLVGI